MRRPHAKRYGSAYASFSPLWEKRRIWYAPNSLRFAHAFSTRAGYSIFDCDVSAPGLAYLWQHSVSARSIVPGTAMLETAAAAVLMFTGGGSSFCWCIADGFIFACCSLA